MAQALISGMGVKSHTVLEDVTGRYGTEQGWGHFPIDIEVRPGNDGIQLETTVRRRGSFDKQVCATLSLAEAKQVRDELDALIDERS